MNWETYKGMTKEQKEEYNFKFKDKKFTINGKGMILSISIFLSTVTQFMMVIYLAIADERFVHLKETVVSLLVGASNIIRITLFFMLFVAIGWIIELFYKLYMEWKWMKDNKIKKIKGVPFWKKNEQKNVLIR